MRILRIRISGLSVYKSDIEIDFYASQRNSEESKQELIQVNKSIYTNPVIELAGLNGAGKTITLKLIVFILSMLNGNSINRYRSFAQDVKRYMDGESFTTEVWYALENKIWYLKTEIGVGEDLDHPDETRLVILGEERWAYTKTTTGKTAWLDSSDYLIQNKRSDEADTMYLPADVSINGAAVRERTHRIQLVSDIQSTDNNLGMFIKEYPVELIQFLDPNIERLTFEQQKGAHGQARLKFVNRKEIVMNEYREVFDYLSSGTIKGLRIFSYALQILKNGGYLVVDELENHFNLEIVKTLVGFFQDPQINIGRGTLIFSTHYPELMDVLTRNDAVYILKNTGGITAEKASVKLKRNDGIKKSEAFVNDCFEGTAPDYDSYMLLKELIKSL